MVQLLSTENIHVNFGGVKALNNLNMYINEGEVVALMGPNGAGKSTILKVIFGLLNIEKGEVTWQGNVIQLKPYELVELGVSLVPQGKRVFGNMNVYENIEIGGHSIRNKNVLKERIQDVLELFPVLSTKLSQKAGTLSGGQQQMVALARGLITNPKLLLLDEPSLGLAPKVVKEVFEKIREINLKKKTSIIIVEHNIKSVLELVDRTYVLSKGEVVAEGEGRSFLESDILERIFLGR